MKIAICEDEAVIAEQIKEITSSYFENLDMEFSVSVFENGKSFNKSGESFDLLFLDYKLSDINGIELAHNIRKSDKNIVIIFVTAYSEHVFESFEVGAFRYILKPIEEDEIKKALYSFLLLYENDLTLCVPTKVKKIYVPLNEVIYIESDAKYSVVRTVDAAYDSIKSLLDFQKVINSQFFIRTHKRYLLNLKYISEIDKNIITLTNGEKVVISRRNLKAFNTAYTNYLKYSV